MRLNGGDALDPQFEQILSQVQRPSRYIGGEWNSVVKDRRQVDLTFALAFPDVYDIGMAHLGFRILYSLLNARPDVAAERVCCPWPDLGDALRQHGRRLASLESQTPLSAFDVVGFSLQYEMTFTNVLEMLDLGGIPLRSAERGQADPIVIAGGPVVFNVEPLADFLDLVFIGDAEELLGEYLDLERDLRRSGVPRAERIRQAAQLEGVYAPALYDLERDEASGLLVPIPRGEAPYPVRRRILLDLDRFPFPDDIVVPHGEIVHDRVSVELMRGCPVGCRFCQAGYIYRPTRERDPNQVRDTVLRSVRSTGYDQFSLTSLNTGEYGAIHPLMVDLMNRLEPEQVSISLSSMHASTITPELAAEVRRVRKSGFTIAPEAGTQRLRDVINKNLDEKQILEACRLAFEAGWEQVKLYFMIGLPTETDEDVDGIVDLAHAILDLGRRIASRPKRVEIKLSASSFVPKPETPFQWVGMERISELYRKQDRIAKRVRRGIRFTHHRCETTFIEGVFSRGDRALGPVIERAWRAGARFDGWDESFRFDLWQAALAESGIDAEAYAHRDLDPRGRLPWQVIDSRVNRKWLALELKRAMAQGTLSVCGPKDCHGCAPFARDCVKGVVAATTGRPLDSLLPVLATPGASSATPAGCCPTPRPVVRPLSAECVTPEKATDRARRRFRATYEKHGRLRFLGHLDLARLLLRALKRAGLELVYSQGFNPRPKVAFSPALSAGIAAEREYFEFESIETAPSTILLEAINAALPDGARLIELRPLDDEEPSLSAIVRGGMYRVDLPESADPDLGIARWLARLDCDIERHDRGRALRFDPSAEVSELERRGPTSIAFTLAFHAEAAALRPDDVLRVMFEEIPADARIVRERIVLADSNQPVRKLSSRPATDAAADVVRAVR